MTTQVYTIVRLLRKATFAISGQCPSTFLCFTARQRSISGSIPSPDMPWKRNGALQWLELSQGAQGGIG